MITQKRNGWIITDKGLDKSYNLYLPGPVTQSQYEYGYKQSKRSIYYLREPEVIEVPEVTQVDLDFPNDNGFEVVHLLTGAKLVYYNFSGPGWYAHEMENSYKNYGGFYHNQQVILMNNDRYTLISGKLSSDSVRIWLDRFLDDKLA